MYRIKHIIILILTILGMSGCSLYSRFTRPEMDFVDSLYDRRNDFETAFKDSTTIGTISWQEFFTDSLLRVLIAEGLENNTNLNVARLRTQEAEYTLKASKLAYYPSVDASVQGGASLSSQNYSVSLGASWEIDAFGRLTNAKRANEMSLEESRAYTQAVQTQLIATIADSYYTLLMLDEQLGISERTIKHWEENIRTLTALKGAGKAHQASVLQARSNKMTVEGNVLTLKKKIADQENALCTLLGRVPAPIQRDTLDRQEFPDSLSAGIPVQLLSMRPDIREAEYSLAKAFYGVNAARAEFYPRLSLSGSVGWADAAGKAVSNPGSVILSLLGSIVQPVFNRGKIKANVKIAQARQEEAKLNFTQKILDAGEEVNAALLQWHTARERINIDKRQIVTLKAAVWNTRLLMRYGRATYLEVLTAQQNLLTAELTESSDKFDEIQGVIRLYHALGGGQTPQ